jgi:hypothetical protein
MFRLPLRASVRTAALAAVLAIPLAGQNRAFGQTPDVEVYYNTLEPKDQFKYKWKGKEGVCSAGVFRWEVPQNQYGTNGFDRNFSGYCAEILVPITAGKLYNFRENNLNDPANYGLGTKDKDKDKNPEQAAKDKAAAQRRADFIKELFGRYFRDPIRKAVNPDEAIALQIALWEVIQETEPADGPPKLDLFSGDFQANYPKAEAPAYVLKAQEYLDSLTGKDVDATYAANADINGRDLIRLQGLTGADGVVAQSQFALRSAAIDGGSGTGGGARALLGGGLGGLGGSFAGAGGLGGTGLLGPGTVPFAGGSGGGGGGFVSTGGTGTTSSTPAGSSDTTGTTGTTSSPPTTSTGTVPVNGGSGSGGDGGSGGGGGGGGNVGTSPVPAPAGLLLGAIALGTLGTWRFGSRLLAAK